ncbi:MAG: TraR/DksA family transcriptional regulator, partial [Cutibacterium sp.]|nr:TraR/DksA family transcriptional regulator [Cutibacterium sp.]
MSDHDVAAIAKSLPVRDGDEPWTVEEVSEIIETLEHDVERMARSLAKSDEDLASLMQEGNDGAGKDTIDVGS